MLTCPACGRENPEDFAFCGACGAALEPQRAREVRKTVTVLFSDVTGSTAIGERLDPESLRRVMERYFDEMKVVLESHGGTVEKFIGDAIMAVFGIPTLHEDDALRALRAAADMRHRLETLNDVLERDFGVRLQARIGVNTGEVVTGQGESRQRLATGDAVNVAARLEQAAEPGQVLIGERTLELVRGAVEVEAIEPLAAKGKSEPLATYLLVGVIEGAPALERRLDAPLVGRRQEIAFVRAAFEEAVTDRRCRLVTVLGPPGIGKSRLAREVASDIGEQAQVLTGRCLPYGEGITYWPVREIFAEAGAEDELDRALAAESAEEVFWSVRKALERRAGERPLLLLIEDIHWAEPTLLDLIEHLTAWTRDAQLAVVCLARPELIDARPGWASQPGGDLLSLEPLSADEADQLIEELVSGADLADETRARVRNVAEGNPLFVEQLLAMLAEGGHSEGVPPTMQALLAARLDALPDEERDILERAAVIGFEFEWEALGELNPDKERPRGTQLMALVRKDLIRPHEAIQDTFRFRHILIRDASYERIPKELRSGLHEGYADWLAERGEEFDEIVGYHLEQAYRALEELGPLGDRARRLAGRAADRLIASWQRADHRGDFAAASKLLERGIGLLPKDDARRVALLPHLGRAHRESGRQDAADSALVEAIELAGANGDRATAADAAITLAELRFHQAAMSRQEVERELEEAKAVFRELGDPAGLARSVGLEARLKFWRGEAEASLYDFEESARLARKAGDRTEEAQALHYVLTALAHGPTPVDEALERLERIGEVAASNRMLDLTLLITRGWLEAMRGRFDVARDLMQQGQMVAEDVGAALSMWGNKARDLGSVEILAGNGAAAERELRPACEDLERAGELGYLSSITPLLADAVYMQGRYEDALLVTERFDPARLTVPEDADAQAAWRRVRAKAFARRGDFTEAERLAREAREIAEPTDHLGLRAFVAADLGEVLYLAGREEEGAAAVAEAVRLFEQKGNVAAVALLGDGYVTVPG